MKNKLLTTTAIALTGFAGAANAVEVTTGAVTMQITGFFRTTVAASSIYTGVSAEDYDGVDILTNSEVHFKPSVTLDNGITVGADIELEGNTTSDQIDESTIFFKGDFGKVELGSKDSAGKQMQIGAPDVSMVYANSTSLTAFVPFYSSVSYPTTFIDFANDADRITYFSPDFGGLQIGASYARNDSQTNGAVNNNYITSYTSTTTATVTTDFMDIGAAYSGKFGGVDIGLSARYGRADRTNTTALGSTDNLDLWGVGYSIGFGDVTVGGGYVEANVGGIEYFRAHDVGVSYVTGPVSYSLTWAHGEGEDGVRESDVLVAAALYKVSSNFKVGVSLSDVERDAEGSSNDIDGHVLAVSAQFNF